MVYKILYITTLLYSSLRNAGRVQEINYFFFCKDKLSLHQVLDEPILSILLTI